MVSGPVDSQAVRREQGAWLHFSPLLACLCAALLLAGCGTVQRLSDSKLTGDTPLDWWHGLQGGRIAEDRPPPPGVDDPYPNLAAVPARPTPTDAATRRALTAQLAAERDRTERAAARDPIVPAGAPAATAAIKAASAPPAAPGSPTTPGAPAPASGATAAQPASAARPPPAGAPAPAPDDEPSKAVLDAATPAAAPSPGRAGRSTPAGPTRTAPASGAPAGPALASGPLPELPAGAPPIPQLPGLPATTFAPPTPRPLPQAVVAFARGSAALPDSADPALRELVSRRSGGGVVVEAGGDADGARPEQQAAAVPLGLARADAIRGALLAAGVPASAIRIEASGLGRTGLARLLP